MTKMEELIEVLEKNGFNIRKGFFSSVEAEGYTKKGISKIFYIENINDFREYVENFNAEEQVSFYDYTESLKDFEDFKLLLKNILKEVTCVQ